MERFRVASLIALSHFSKLLVNLLIMRQIALIYGPEGLGFLGNFMSLVALATTLSGGGIVSGVIKYTAEYSKNSTRLYEFIGSTIVYSVISSVLMFILGLIFINALTEYVFLSSEFKGFIYFFLSMQFFIAINNGVFGLSNGLKKTNIYAVCTIGGNVIATVLAIYIIPRYGYWGAIVAIASPAFAAFIPISLCFFLKYKSFIKKINFNSVKQDSKLLSHYSLMLLCSAVCFPIVEMIIRNWIVESSGLDTAGYWQAITRFSLAYLSFYSLLLSFYFVPLISGLKDSHTLFNEVKKMIFFILSLFIPMMILFFIFKKQIIQHLFSTAFLPVLDLFFLQMIGDLFRVIGWVIGFIIVAKAMSAMYVVCEILQALIFITLCYIQLSYAKGLDGIVVAYVTTCVVYCIAAFSSFLLLCTKNNWQREHIKI